MDEEVLVTDVTAQVIGERRAEWRDGFDQGTREGARRVANSECMQQIAFDLTVHRVVVNGMMQVAEQRERLLAHWKAEAQWWREEHNRVHAEFCEYAKAVERKFCR
jgi:hypothetical protein